MTDAQKLAHIENSYRGLVAQIDKERRVHKETTAEVKLLRARLEMYETANNELLARIANAA